MASNSECAMSKPWAVEQWSCAYEPLRLLARIGLWGGGKGWLRSCAPTFIFAQAVYGFVSAAINVAQTWGTMAQAAEFCVVLLQMLMTCVKLRCLLLNTIPIKEVISTLKKMRDEHEVDDDVNQIRHRTQYASGKFTRLIHSASICPLFSVVFAAIVAGYFKHKIPFRRWYPYNFKASPMLELTLVVYGILTILDYYYIMLFDLLFLSLVAEVIGEFKALQYRLKYIDCLDNMALQPLSNTNLKNQEDADAKQLVNPEVSANSNTRVNSKVNLKDNVKGKETDKVQHNIVLVASASAIQQAAFGTTHRMKQPEEFGTERLPQVASHGKTTEKRLSACVEQHQVLISIVSKLETMFQPALVINLVCNFSVGLTLAYVTLKSTSNVTEMVNMLAVGVVCVCEFAFYCYFCTQITTEVMNTAYNMYGLMITTN